MIPLGSSFEEMRGEIRNQMADLPRFASLLRRETSRLREPSRAVFVGSGDSYAAALFAHQVSGRQARAEDPYELDRNLNFARAKDVAIISVTGRTLANVNLARRLRRVARRTIAITAAEESPLAQTCDQTIVLTYTKAAVGTSGTISFTTSLLACSWLLSKLPRNILTVDALSRAEKWAKEANPRPSGSFWFVGSGVDNALGEYGACKIQEVLGARASAHFPEQVGHSLLFSIDKKRDTVICIGAHTDPRVRKVYGALSSKGFNVIPLDLAQQNAVTRGLECSLHIQELALSLARRRRLKECAFLVDKDRLRLSSKLIY